MRKPTHFGKEINTMKRMSTESIDISFTKEKCKDGIVRTFPACPDCGHVFLDVGKDTYCPNCESKLNWDALKLPLNE